LSPANAMFLAAADAKSGPAGLLAKLVRESKPYLPNLSSTEVTREDTDQ